MMVTRRSLMGAPALLPALAAAQPGWPDRPVRVIVPVPAGTAPDIVARRVSDALAAEFRQPFPVENRFGAEGTIAVEAFLNARPGEALLCSPASAITVTPLFRQGFEPMGRVTPVAGLVTDIFGTFVSPALPVRDLPSLVAALRERGEAVNWWASPGIPYLTFRAFLRDIGAEGATYVPMRGAPQAVPEMLAGRLHLFFTPLPNAIALSREGRIGLIATHSAARAPAAPDVPTSAEQGFPAFAAEGLIALFGWSGMAASLAERLAALGHGAMAEGMMANGQVPRRDGPAALAAILAEQRARFGPLARAFPLPG